MKSEDQVLAALRALAEHDGERDASEGVEIRLRKAFRRRREARRAAIWSLATAAVVAAIFLTIPREHLTPALVTKPAPPPEIATVVEPPVPPPIRPVRRKAAPQTPREIVTEFFPLMDVPCHSTAASCSG